MPEEHVVGWYAPSTPIRMEVITDHTGWREIEPYGVGYLPGCFEGTVRTEPGYLRAMTLFGDDPQTYGTLSNIRTVPEASALWVGVLALCALFGRRRR